MLIFLAIGLALVLYTSLGVAIFGGSAQLALILAGVDVLAGAVLAGTLSPLIMLRPDLVRIWHGFKFVNIGTGEVAGIGMLYTRSNASYRDGGRWRLYIWRADGTGEMTAYIYVPRNAAMGVGEYTRPWTAKSRSGFDPLAASEAAELKTSRAATVSRDLNQRILAAQGHTGPLATRRLEQHSRAVPLDRYDRVIGYWSPDGQTGRG